MTSNDSGCGTAIVKGVEDSFIAMRALDNKCFDVVITDPPYNEHVQGNLCSGSLVGTKNVPKYELRFKPLSKYEFCNDLIRVARRWVVMFCALEDLGIIRQVVTSDFYVRGCIWYKPNAMGQLTKDRPATAFEAIALLHTTNEKYRWNGKGSFGIWQCNGTRGKKGRHPNEKPLALCRKLVALFSEPGETVFDPFAGSGAIGEAAKSLGRNYIGWDQDESWVAKASDRLLTTKPYDGPDPLTLCRMNQEMPEEPRKTEERPLLPCDYEACGDCGYDHEYEFNQAYAWHSENGAKETTLGR
jgi:site-specific DNA-methyltransferase (adenine-specific)